MDLNKIVGALGSSGALGGFAGGVAGGAVTSALLSKKGRKHARTLLTAGGIAAVGGLAWKAYQSYQQSQAAPAGAMSTAAAKVESESAPLARQDFDVPAEIPSGGDSGSRGLLLIRAMIAAAVSDGHMDDAERSRILSRMRTMDLDAAEKALVADELLHPRKLEDIAAAVTDRAAAIEVYAASLLAVDESREEARAYLDALAARLSLPPLLIEVLTERPVRGQPEAA